MIEGTVVIRPQTVHSDVCVYSTSDGQPAMLQTVHGDEANSIQVVVVHNLQLLPRDRTRLALQKAET